MSWFFSSRLLSGLLLLGCLGFFAADVAADSGYLCCDSCAAQECHSNSCPPRIMEASPCSLFRAAEAPPVLVEPAGQEPGQNLLAENIFHPPKA